jgi:hypothetical protein
MAQNDSPKKPEWFEMAEQDVTPADYIEESARPLKTSVRLPFVALLATGAILAGGAVFANISEEQPASAENVSVAADQTSDVVTSDGSTDPILTDTTSENPSGNATTDGVTNPSSNNGSTGIQNPAQNDPGTMAIPGKGSHHDDDEGDDDDDFRPRGHHEEHEDDDHEEEDDD